MNKIKLTALPCICADVFYGTDIIRPGGEALNFAAHASHFKNVDVTLLGIVGKDKYAEVIMDSIQTLAFDKDHIRIDERYPTANNMTYLTASGDRYYKDDPGTDRFSITSYSMITKSKSYQNPMWSLFIFWPRVFHRSLN